MTTIVTVTGDGSPTLYVPELNEHYHSMHGAIQESAHVFIKNGLNRRIINNVRLFEVGFGSGLNALLSCNEAENQKRSVYYHSIEKFPLQKRVCDELQEYFKNNFPQLSELYLKINRCEWDKEIQITNFFTLKKIKADLISYYPAGIYDIIFFDAFGPQVQPAMWTTEVFSKIAGMMDSSAVLATYSAKGQVRRNLISVGLLTERIAGPPGKREMLVATKP